MCCKHYIIDNYRDIKSYDYVKTNINTMARQSIIVDFTRIYKYCESLREFGAGRCDGVGRLLMFSARAPDCDWTRWGRWGQESPPPLSPLSQSLTKLTFKWSTLNTLVLTPHVSQPFSYIKVFGCYSWESFHNHEGKLRYFELV